MTATVNEQATTTVRGACPHDCPDTCAMLVSVRDGRAVEVRGDPGHPFTRGGLCVKVNNYVDKTYSPDRVLYPMRRSGPKGSGQFTRVSWDEALVLSISSFHGRGFFTSGISLGDTLARLAAGEAITQAGLVFSVSFTPVPVVTLTLSGSFTSLTSLSVSGSAAVRS